MNNEINVFIVDKEEISKQLLQNYLSETAKKINFYNVNTVDEIKNNVNEKIHNILIADVSDFPEKIIAKIDRLSAELPFLKIIIVSYDLKTDLIVKTLRQSKKEFLTKPVIKGELIKIFNELTTSINPESAYKETGKIIAVFSNKGGLGKTTAAVNIAGELALLKPDNKVLLIDLNTYLGDVTSFLDLEPTYDLKYACSKLQTVKEGNLSEIAERYADTNVFILADSPFREFDTDIPDDAIIALLKEARNSFAYTVIDCSSAITPRSEKIFKTADMILTLTAANIPAVINCKRCIDFLENRENVAYKTKIIVNRYSYEDECKISDIEKVSGQKVFAKIPNDWKTVTDALNKGITIREHNPESAVAEAYAKTARLISDGL